MHINVEQSPWKIPVDVVSVFSPAAHVLNCSVSDGDGALLWKLSSNGRQEGVGGGFLSRDVLDFIMKLILREVFFSFFLC